MILHRWLTWFKREKILLVIASLALGLAALSPWYRLPPQTIEAFGCNLVLTHVGKGLAAFFSVLNLVLFLGFKPNQAWRLILYMGLIWVLFFPFFITTWFPSVSLVATEYQKQLQNVILHVEKNFPEVQSQWKKNILLSLSKDEVSTVNFQIKDTRSFQISSWNLLVEDGLGYNNGFLGLIGSGWGLTVFGFLVSIIALYLDPEIKTLSPLLSDIKKLLPWIGLGLASLIIFFLTANIIDYQIDRMLAKGEYQKVLRASQVLENLYPPVKGDEKFIQRRAEAGFYGNDSEPSLIYFSQGLEHYHLNDFFRAQDYFQKSLVIQPQNFLIKTYLARAILNQGVNFFNNSETGAAVDCFEQVLRVFPNHIEALYDLMLANVVNDNFEKSAQAAKKIIEIQQFFQLKSMALLGQAYLHSTWAVYHSGDTTKAWKEYRKSVDQGAWK